MWVGGAEFARREAVPAGLRIMTHALDGSAEADQFVLDVYSRDRGGMRSIIVAPLPQSPAMTRLADAQVSRHHVGALELAARPCTTAVLLVMSILR